MKVTSIFAPATAILALTIGLSGEAQSQAGDGNSIAVAPNESWITVTGTVVKTAPEAFRLDHGNGVITVEMDDFDSYGEARVLMENDQVSVHGKVDDDLFEKKTIEAASVYVESLNTHFYANPADEEDFSHWTVVTPLNVGTVELTGRVTSITGREFTVKTGVGKFQVDTASMIYNPMDDNGFLQIDKGDKVKVSGKVDNKLWDEPEISADWIIERK